MYARLRKPFGCFAVREATDKKKRADHIAFFLRDLLDVAARWLRRDS